MSGFQENQFPSQFDNSPLDNGPFADHVIEQTDNSLESTQSNDLPAYLPRPIRKRLKLRAFGHEAPKTCTAPNSFVRAQITVTEGSDANLVRGGRFEDIASAVSFTIDDFEELDCLAIGLDFIYAIEANSQDRISDLKLIVKKYLQWVFINDPQAQEDLLETFMLKATAYYLENRPVSKRSAFVKVLFMIQALAKEAMNEVISYFFQLIADELRKLKIDEGREDLWKPVVVNNKIVYNPIFINDLKIDFNSFFKKIDESNHNVSQQVKSKDWSKDGMNEMEAYYSDSFSLEFTRFYQELIDSIKSVLQVYNQFAESARIINAFLVGLYNGLIEMIAGIFELVATLLSTEKIEETINGIKKLIEQIKQGGISELLTKIIDAFIEKYKNAESNYDAAKYVGEDLLEIIFTVIVGILTGGIGATINGVRRSVTLAKNLPKALEKLFKDIKNPDQLKKRLQNRNSDSKLVLDPPSFTKLSNTQKIAYHAQEKILRKVEADGQVPKGKKTKKDGSTVDRKDTDYTTKGSWGEISMDQKFLNWTPPQVKPLHKMISDLDEPHPSGYVDGVFENVDFTGSPPPPKYFIVEAKSFDSKLRSKTADGKQMSKRWIFNKRLENTLRNNPEFENYTKREMKALIEEISDNYASLLFEKKSINAPPIITQLDDDAARIGKGIESLNNVKK